MAKIVNKITFFVLLLEACKFAMNIWCVYFQFPTNAIFKYASRYAEELVAVYIYNNRSMCEHTMYQDAYVHYPRICRSLSTLFVMWYECGVVSRCWLPMCASLIHAHATVAGLRTHTVHLYHAASVFLSVSIPSGMFFSPSLVTSLSLLVFLSYERRRQTDRQKTRFKSAYTFDDCEAT